MHRLILMVLLSVTCAWINIANAEPILTITVDGKPQSYSIDALLKRSDVVEIKIEHDVAYQRPMTYRAIPLAALFNGSGFGVDTFLEVKALDGFVSQLPNALVQNRDRSKAIAMLAVE